MTADQIKQSTFQALASKALIIIEATDYGYCIRQWTPDSVAPSSDYDTPQEAIARAAQLLGVQEPITPQSWAEVAQIGSIQ